MPLSTVLDLARRGVLPGHKSVGAGSSCMTNSNWAYATHPAATAPKHASNLLRARQQVRRDVAPSGTLERIAQLERRLNRSSRNSSQPPSADPPGAPPRRGKDSAGRWQGGQPGREGKGRPLLPAWAVDQVVEHWPDRCDCGHEFAESERVAVGEPVRHQVEELPPITVTVTEHRCQRVRCPGCGRRRRARLPREVAASSFGPRLQAAIATLSVRNRISRRDVVELCEQLFGSRISTGTVDAILARTADALADPCDDLLEQLRASAAVHMDETGWRTAGQRRALWGIFDDRHAYLHVAADRHEDHAKQLLADTKAIVTTDRWWAYSHLPLKRRQLCWAHLARDFKAHAEGMAAEKEFGEQGQRTCERVFWAFEIYQHTHDRRGYGLVRQRRPARHRYPDVLGKAAVPGLLRRDAIYCAELIPTLEQR
jgi:transposase